MTKIISASDLLKIILDTYYQLAIGLWNNPMMRKIIIGFIVSSVVVWIIKQLAYRNTYSVSRMEGFTHRQSKRRAKKATEIVDLVSTVHDLSDSFKK